MYNHILLRQIREDKGITQSEMAEMLGYSDPSGYTKIEATGERDIPLTKVQGIKNILKLTDKQVREIFLQSNRIGNK